MTATGEEGRLRALLEDAVSDVEPRPGLDAIRTRTAASRRRPWLIGAAAAVIGTAALVGAVVGSGTDPDTRRPPAGADHGLSRRLTVYYVGDTAAGPRLFPERHTRLVGGAPEAAVQEAVTGAADDPEHRTPWPAGTSVAGVRRAGGVLTVDLSGEVARRPSGMPAVQARLAVQQVVWTAQAVVHRRLPVRFLLEGRPTPQLLGVPTDHPVTAAPPGLVLAPGTP
jgi:Sporulation and spore germination